MSLHDFAVVLGIVSILFNGCIFVAVTSRVRRFIAAICCLASALVLLLLYSMS
jgi:hypothetical protein